MTTSVGIMNEISRYENDSTLKDFLSDQLVKGRLLIVLGAGASIGFGLPNWDELTKRLFNIIGKTKQEKQSNEDAAEEILMDHLKGDHIKFAKLVHDALYLKYDLSFDKISKNSLLASIGAITMVSRRGNVSKVVSFNYDDLLELYLFYFGFNVESFYNLPHWDSRTDIKIFHPHGFLPHNKKDEIKKGIVFTQLDYDRIIGKESILQRQLLLLLFQTNICLFIGLSGADKNLSSILLSANEGHVGHGSQLFWGIRFSDDENDPKKNMWKTRGVYQKTLKSHDELPSWLFEICQRAANKVK